MVTKIKVDIVITSYFKAKDGRESKSIKILKTDNVLRPILLGLTNLIIFLCRTFQFARGFHKIFEAAGLVLEGKKVRMPNISLGGS